MAKIKKKVCRNVKVTEVTVIDNTPPPPRVKFKNINTVLRKDVTPSYTSNPVLRKDVTPSYTSNPVLCKDVIPSYTSNPVLRKDVIPSYTSNEVIDITDDYDYVFNQASSSEKIRLNVEDNFTIDITDSFVDESEPKVTAILSSEVKGLNVENEPEKRRTAILSSEVKGLNVENKPEKRRTVKLSSEVKGLNVENESEQRRTAILSSEVKYSNNTDDFIINITDSIIDESEPKNIATLSSDVKSLNVKDKWDQRNTAILSSKEKLHGKIFSPAISVHNNEIELIILDSDNEEDTQDKQKDKQKDKEKEKRSVKKSASHKILKESYGISDQSKKDFKRQPNKNVRYHKQLLNVVNSSLNLDALSVNYQNRLPHSNTEEIQNVRVPFVPPQPCTTSPCTTLKTTRQLRPIYIDGLNIGHAYGHGIFAVKGIELCIEFFAARGHTDILVFIPHHRLGPPGSLSRYVLEKLHRKGHVCYTPSRKINDLRMTCYDDRIILNQAVKFGAVVISNDNFRDLYVESAAFREVIETRHVMVTFARDEIIVPDDQYNRGPFTLNLSDILCFPT